MFKQVLGTTLLLIASSGFAAEKYCAVYIEEKRNAGEGEVIVHEYSSSDELLANTIGWSSCMDMKYCVQEIYPTGCNVSKHTRATEIVERLKYYKQDGKICGYVNYEKGEQMTYKQMIKKMMVQAATVGYNGDMPWAYETEAHNGCAEYYGNGS